MEFRTTIKTREHPGLLQHSDTVLLLGSCFSDNVGAKMRAAMMRAEVNPVGTLYNPMSIADTVRRLLACEPVAGMDLFQQGGVWNSFAFHSRYSLPGKDATLQLMNRRVEQGHEWLLHCRLLVVTLGSAMVYRHRDSGRVVANCHKVPQHEFERSMAPAADMSRELLAMCRAVHEANPRAHILFTVSPIRHIADGLEVNSLSKARLRVAVDDVVSACAGWTGYFPAFELVNDDLRDYRFYAPDMVHPSEVAVEYIWQTFQATYLDDRSAQAVARCERVSKRLQHRPITAGGEAQKRFLADTRHVVRNLVKEYPYLQSHPDIVNFLDPTS